TASMSPLDVSDLTDRSDDWVGVIDGGPGMDTLRGTGARDRIDGGAGNDKIYGYDGDDQLWGDGGPGLGNTGDHDKIYGGQGNDDLLGGQGTNELFAWSDSPFQAIHSSGPNASGSRQELAPFSSVPDNGKSAYDSVFVLTTPSGVKKTISVL